MDVSVLLSGGFFPRLFSSVTLLRSEGRTVLVDTSGPEQAGALMAALASHGLGRKDIDTVLTTHLHYDHCGNHLLFPKARYVVSAEDYADTATFMSSYHADFSPGKSTLPGLLRARHDVIKDYYLRSIVREVGRNLEFYDLLRHGDPRFLLLEGSHYLTSDIEVVPTPGHTRGHLSVVVHGGAVGDHGARRDLLVAGDALATRGVLGPGGESNIHLAMDARLYQQTRRVLLERYRFIIPGHDGLVDRDALVETEIAAHVEAAVS
jgi:glyoxylase-like metal-dependent hydrolase (beta-lactamase superfamily II)